MQRRSRQPTDFNSLKPRAAAVQPSELIRLVLLAVATGQVTVETATRLIVLIVTDDVSTASHASCVQAPSDNAGEVSRFALFTTRPLVVRLSR